MNKIAVVITYIFLAVAAFAVYVSYTHEETVPVGELRDIDK